MDYETLSANDYLAAGSSRWQERRQRSPMERERASDLVSPDPALSALNDNAAFLRSGSMEDLQGPKVAYSSLAFAMLQESRDQARDLIAAVPTVSRGFNRERYEQILDLFEAQDGSFHAVQPAAIQAYETASLSRSPQTELNRGYASALQLGNVI